MAIAARGQDDSPKIRRVVKEAKAIIMLLRSKDHPIQGLALSELVPVCQGGNLQLFLESINGKTKARNCREKETTNEGINEGQ